MDAATCAPTTGISCSRAPAALSCCLQAGLERCPEDNALSHPLRLPLCLGSVSAESLLPGCRMKYLEN